MSFNQQRAAKGDALVDFFIFGHYHCSVDLPVGSARLLLLRDWMTVDNWIVYDAGAGVIR